jgi:hypothetical protein
MSHRRTLPPAKRRTLAAARATMAEATRSCEAALRSRNLRLILRHIRSAKKSYARALRLAWKLALTKDGVRALEHSSVLLERAIARLELRHRILARLRSRRGAGGP